MSDAIASFVASEEEVGERLDTRLAAHLDLPRNQIRQWIQQGAVLVNGKGAKPSTSLASGDAIEWRRPEPQVDLRVVPQEGPLQVLYEDAEVIVLDKPAGVAVHPGAGRKDGTLVNWLLARYPELSGVGGPGRPGIVHRLDMDTTGVMVIARQASAYQSLSRDFAERRVDKHYQAIAYGTPQSPNGVIDLPIGRHRQDRKKMAVSKQGRPSRTVYRCVDSGEGVCRFDLDLETGRTHQIRVHLKAIHHPLVGDPVYGEARWKNWPRKRQPILSTFPRPALHAWRLAFRHPRRGELLRFEAATPEDMRELWQRVTGRPWKTSGTA